MVYEALKENDHGGFNREPQGNAWNLSLREQINRATHRLFEVFCNLDLASVFFLARTTKGLHNTLMHRPSALIWKRAYANSKASTNFPDCPNDLTVPQFAHLAFDPVCHYCCREKCYTIMWTARTRCCSQCRGVKYRNVSREPLTHLTFARKASQMAPGGMRSLTILRRLTGLVPPPTVNSTIETCIPWTL